MRCKACDAELSDVDMTRKGTDGAYLDLCTACFNASTEALYEDRQNMEVLVDATPSEEPPEAVWSRVVVRSGALERWRDGLWGERTDQQVLNIEQEHYDQFMVRVGNGEQPQIAAERTLKINTQNQ